MKTKLIAVMAVSGMVLASCTNMQDNPKQGMGTIMGAGVGALAGSQVGGGKGQLAAVAIGALAGAMAGGEIGKSLDRADKAYMQQAAHNSLENNRTGVATSWKNPDSGHAGTVTPTRTYQVEGQDCRDYETTVTIDGKIERATGRACRQPDGTWRIAS